MTAPKHETYMTPDEVASLFGVTSKTVTRWAATGRIEAVKTPGGHYRIRTDVVQALTRPVT